MYERFSEKTNELEMLAEEEAEGFGHSRVGPEHLLLGLLRQEGGVACRVLGRFGITLEGTRRRLASAAVSGEPTSDRKASWSPRANEVLRRAVREAFDLGRSYVGPEHVLLALTRESGGALAAVLPDGEAELGPLREELLRMLGRQADAGYRAPVSETHRVVVGGLAVEAHVAATTKRRLKPRRLVAHLDYGLGPEATEEPAAVAEEVARSLARPIFKSLQEAADHAAQRALDARPGLQDIKLTLTDPGADSGSWSPPASAEAWFFR